MRSDYVLYIIGVAFLVVAGYALFDQASLESILGGVLIYSAVVFVLILFGVTSLIFGYSLRPKKQTMLSIHPPPSVQSLTELSRVKGIGEKREQQLKTIGITTVTDLSAASAEELAEKLQISPKITDRWIKNARDLLLEK